MSEGMAIDFADRFAQHFLKDIDADRPPKFPSPCFYYQSCENPSLRAQKKIPADESGILSAWFPW